MELVKKGEEVLLRIKGNLSFIGSYQDAFHYQGHDGVLIRLDKKSRIMIWAPNDMILEIHPLMRPLNVEV